MDRKARVVEISVRLAEIQRRLAEVDALRAEERRLDDELTRLLSPSDGRSETRAESTTDEGETEGSLPDRITAELRDGAKTVPQLIEKIDDGVGGKSLRGALQRMFRMGRVERVGRGEYQLPAKGAKKSGRRHAKGEGEGESSKE